MPHPTLKLVNNEAKPAIAVLHLVYKIFRKTNISYLLTRYVGVRIRGGGDRNF